MVEYRFVEAMVAGSNPVSLGYIIHEYAKKLCHMSKVKFNKIKLEYINEKISKKPQIIIGELLRPKKSLKKNVKIIRKIAYEKFIHIFPLYNMKKVANISIY